MAVVELIMPKMGESIIEATIIGWLKNEGDRVEADETILEVATDKVDSEVPSPVVGILKKILFQKDEVVGVGVAMALIETDEVVDSKASDKPISEKKQDKQVGEEEPVKPLTDDHPGPLPASSVTKEEATSKKALPFIRKSVREKIPSNVSGRFYSPLVRNIARAEGITLEELNRLKGSGADGRVTKFDLLNYIDLLKLEATSSLQRARTTSISNKLIREEITQEAIDTGSPIIEERITRATTSDEIIEVSRMRKVIANHMKHSLDTAAHVTTFVEADATKVVNWRNKVKEEYLNRHGQKLTFSPIFSEIVIKALQDFPEINASFDGENMILKKSINLGIATAMENGNLIVPVLSRAGELNLLGLTKKLNDITGRARKNQLTPDEIQGGTFTITNIGTFGNIMGTPIIPQPQLAILALGAIKKKPVIQETDEGDIIAIRHMMFLSLSFDHRVIDGYKGGSFLNRIAHYIETFDVNRPV